MESEDAGRGFESQSVCLAYERPWAQSSGPKQKQNAKLGRSMANGLYSRAGSASGGDLGDWPG